MPQNLDPEPFMEQPDSSFEVYPLPFSICLLIYLFIYLFIYNGIYCWWWWLVPLMLALGRKRQVDLCEFEASLFYRASSGTARTTQKNHVSKNKTNRNTTI